eukprot:1188396-Prorocentrum_minimum.AAC.3
MRVSELLLSTNWRTSVSAKRFMGRRPTLPEQNLPTRSIREAETRQGESDNTFPNPVIANL